MLVSSRNHWSMRLVTSCIVFTVCTITRAQELATPTVESVESHLESTREFETLKSTQAAVESPVSLGAAIYSPFARAETPDATTRSAVDIQSDDVKSNFITAVIAAVACCMGLGLLFLVLPRRD
jgi:hypothetical protein